MKHYLQEVGKNALILGVVGALLAASAPLLAMGLCALGSATFAGATGYAAAATILAHSANVAWLGAFFGGFGAIDAAVRPAFNRLFRHKPAAETSATLPEKTAAVFVAEPGQTISNHRMRIETERTEISNTPARLH